MISNKNMVLAIYVGRSQPFGKDDYQPSDFIESDAVVTISGSNGEQHTLTLNSGSSSVYSCSQLDFTIVPGETYTIKVKGSLLEATAETTVPLLATVWKEVNLSGPEEYYYYTFSGSWDAVSITKELNYEVSLKESNEQYSRANQ